MKNKGYLHKSKLWTLFFIRKILGIKPCVISARSEMKTSFHFTRSLDNKKLLLLIKIYDGNCKELLDIKSAKTAVFRLTKLQKDLIKFQK